MARVRVPYLHTAIPSLLLLCCTSCLSLFFVEHAGATEVIENKILTLKAQLNSTATEKESLQGRLDATVSEMEVRETSTSSVDIEPKKRRRPCGGGLCRNFHFVASTWARSQRVLGVRSPRSSGTSDEIADKTRDKYLLFAHGTPSSLVFLGLWYRRRPCSLSLTSAQSNVYLLIGHARIQQHTAG